MLPKKRVISIDVSFGRYKEFVDAIIGRAQNNESAYVCVANVHMLIEAVDSDDFNKIVNQADIVTPDGIPLAKAFGHLYGIKQDRVDGMSLIPALVKEAINKKVSVYFYGGSDALVIALDSYLKRAYPELKVAGIYSPPFRLLTDKENQEIINNINNSGAQLVFVALGCPKQEKWMASMKGKIQATMIGIGGALPVFVGLQKRAPAIMQKVGLEWLFRLFQEPQRLFKRYFYTNSYYLFLFGKQLIKKRFYSK